MKLFTILSVLVCVSSANAFAFGSKKPTVVSEETKLLKLPMGQGIVLTADLAITHGIEFTDGTTHYFFQDFQRYTYQGRLNLDVAVDGEYCEIISRDILAPVVIPAGTVFTVTEKVNASHLSNLVTDVEEGYQFAAVSLGIENAKYPQIKGIYCRSDRGYTDAIRVKGFNRLLGSALEIKF